MRSKPREENLTGRVKCQDTWFDSSFLFFSISGFASLSQLFAFTISARADTDLFLYIYLCVARLLCLIIMFCSHSASSPLRSIGVTLCFDKNSPVWSSPVECLTLSLPSLPVVPPDCTAFCGGCCSPLWPGPQVKSATVFQFFDMFAAGV